MQKKLTSLKIQLPESFFLYLLVRLGNNVNYSDLCTERMKTNKEQIHIQSVPYYKSTFQGVPMNIYKHEQYIYGMSHIHSVRVMSGRRELRSARKRRQGGFGAVRSACRDDRKKEVSGLGGY